MPVMSFIANDSPRSCVEFSPLTFLKNIKVSYLVECPLVWDFLMFPHGKIEIMHFFIGTSKKCCILLSASYQEVHAASSSYNWLY